MSNTPLQPFKFLELPCEVRVRIYYFLFECSVLCISDGVIDYKQCDAPGRAICQTNSLIYKEAILELYTNTILLYEQKERNIGPGDMPLAPHLRRLIRNLVLRRLSHWTQFKINRTILKGYTNLRTLYLLDDSRFVFSLCEKDEALHTDLQDLLTEGGPAYQKIIGIMLDTFRFRGVQPLPIVGAESLAALGVRDVAMPTRGLRIRYCKSGVLIDVQGQSVLLVSSHCLFKCLITNTISQAVEHDTNSGTIYRRHASHRSLDAIVDHWGGRMNPPPEISYVRSGLARYC